MAAPRPPRVRRVAVPVLAARRGARDDQGVLERGDPVRFSEADFFSFLGWVGGGVGGGGGGVVFFDGVCLYLWRRCNVLVMGVVVIVAIVIAANMSARIVVGTVIGADFAWRAGPSATAPAITATNITTAIVADVRTVRWW